MRLKICVVLALIICLIFIPTIANATVAFKIGDNTYTQNGQLVNMDAAPYLKSGRVFVPVRYIAESLGAYVLYQDGYIRITKQDKAIELNVGSKSIRLNDSITNQMDVEVELKNGRTYLPARYVAEGLGATISWNEQTAMVTITPPKPESPVLLPDGSNVEENFQKNVQQAQQADQSSTDLSWLSPEAQALINAIREYRQNNPVYIPFPAGTPTTGTITRRYYGFSTGHWIKRNYSGEFIELEDRSLWQIHSLDKIHTRLWLPVDNITVIESDNYSYPYFLINQSTGDCVYAKFLSK